jgi:hypothetical protein
VIFVYMLIGYQHGINGIGQKLQLSKSTIEIKIGAAGRKDKTILFHTSMLETLFSLVQTSHYQLFLGPKSFADG